MREVGVLDRSEGGAGRNAHEVALGQELGDLDGVGRGALAQVVADDPQVEAAVVRGVAADAADEDLVRPAASVPSG